MALCISKRRLFLHLVHFPNSEWCLSRRGGAKGTHPPPGHVRRHSLIVKVMQVKAAPKRE